GGTVVRGWRGDRAGLPKLQDGGRRAVRAAPGRAAGAGGARLVPLRRHHPARRPGAGAGVARARAREAGRVGGAGAAPAGIHARIDRKSTRLNSSHEWISYAVFCLENKTSSANTMMKL